MYEYRAELKTPNLSHNILGKLFFKHLKLIFIPTFCCLMLARLRGGHLHTRLRAPLSGGAYLLGGSGGTGLETQQKYLWHHASVIV